jgi:3-oxoacyl-[acyl-carrier protein] reductase
MGRGALAGYLKTLAAEVAADRVTVNLVLPGRIETNRMKHVYGAVAEGPGGLRRAGTGRCPGQNPGGPVRYP